MFNAREKIKIIDQQLENFGKSGSDVFNFGYETPDYKLEGYKCENNQKSRVFGTQNIIGAVQFPQSSTKHTKILLIVPETADLERFMQYFEEGVLSKYQSHRGASLPGLSMLFVLSKN